MSDVARLYTPAEAGAVSGLNLKAVHNAIDKRVVEPMARELGSAETQTGRTSRFLTGADLLRLRVWRGVGDSLSAERRRALFSAIDASPEAGTLKADELLIVDVGEARRQVERGVRDLHDAEAIVVKDKGILGGEPVFKGTRVPVYAIAAMLDAGASAEELLEGYPSLDAPRLKLARIWASAHPRRGRPKRLSELGLEPTSTRRRPLPDDPLTKPTLPSEDA